MPSKSKYKNAENAINKLIAEVNTYEDIDEAQNFIKQFLLELNTIRLSKRLKLVENRLNELEKQSNIKHK